MRNTRRLSLLATLVAALSSGSSIAPAYADPTVDCLLAQASPECLAEHVYVDLTWVDDTLDTVYQAVPSPWGVLSVVVHAADFAYDEARDDGSGGQGEDSGTCTQHSTTAQVMGGANPPTRTVTYRDRDGYYEGYVQGSATIMSCLEQDIWVSTREDLGFSGRALSITYRVPARRWVTIDGPRLECHEAANDDNGFSYYTRAETVEGYGGYPDWQNESSYRRWKNC